MAQRSLKLHKLMHLAEEMYNRYSIQPNLMIPLSQAVCYVVNVCKNKLFSTKIHHEGRWYHATCYEQHKMFHMDTWLWFRIQNLRRGSFFEHGCWEYNNWGNCKLLSRTRNNSLRVNPKFRIIEAICFIVRKLALSHTPTYIVWSIGDPSFSK
jgi:hypothetical protein